MVAIAEVGLPEKSGVSSRLRTSCELSPCRPRKQIVFFILGGFFLTNAILGELTGGKLLEIPEIDLGWFHLPSVVLSIGVLPWPIVFVTTDLINEYFGKPGVQAHFPRGRNDQLRLRHPVPGHASSGVGKIAGVAGGLRPGLSDNPTGSSPDR